jgi:hypothetical protein
MVGAVKDYDARLRMIGVVEKAGERARGYRGILLDPKFGYIG